MPDNRSVSVRTIDAVFWMGITLYLAVLHVEKAIAVRNLGFLMILAATALLLVRRKQRPEFPFWLPWAIYTAIALTSVSYSVDPSYSLRNIQSELWYGALLLIACASWSRQSRSFGNFLLVLIAVNALLELVTYSFARFGDGMEKVQHLPPLARAGVNSNFLVSVLPFLALAIWWFRREKRMAIAFAAAALIAVDLGALVISYNRQSFVAVLASVLCAGILTLSYRFTWRRMAVFLALILLASSLLGIQLARRSDTGNVDKSAVTSDVRWRLWAFSLDKIANKPMTGTGFGRETSGKAYPEVINLNPSMFLWHAHNMVINKGVQMGIPGMIAFLLLWSAMLRELARHLGTTDTRHAIAVATISMAVAVFLKNMTDDHFLRDPAYLFWILTGMSVGSLRLLKHEEKIGSC